MTLTDDAPPGRVTLGRVTLGRVAQDRVAQDRVTQDRVTLDPVTPDRAVLGQAAPGDHRRQPTIRCFVAVDLGAMVRARVDEVIGVLRGAGAEVRWIPVSNLHVTLKFLGAVPPDRVPVVGESMGRVAAGMVPFDLTARGVGAFPGMRRARVVWVGIDGAPLTELAGRIDAVLAEEGFAPEGRTFTGHVTIGRVRGPRRWDRVRELMERYAAEDFGCTHVDDVVLYRSDLEAAGARYTVLHRVRLAGQAVRA